MNFQKYLATLGFVLLLMLFGQVGRGWAKMVRYIDYKGDVHYVNTKFSKVPARYLDQVQDQLADEKPQDEGKPTLEQEEDETAEIKEGVLVEVFTKKNCEGCRKLEILLKVFNIEYNKFNVETSEYGKKAFNDIGGELPITRIGEKVFHGFNIKQIEKELKNYSP